MKVKASVTVEAALVCPLLCLFLCGMILCTMKLYSRVDTYSKELQERTGKRIISTDLIRIEAITEELL